MRRGRERTPPRARTRLPAFDGSTPSRGPRAVRRLLHGALPGGLRGRRGRAGAVGGRALPLLGLERQDRHFFEDHVDGVTEFLQASFSMAGTEIALGDEDESGGLTSNKTGNEIETDGSEVTVDISENNNSNGGNSMDGDTTESTTGSGLVRVSEDPIDWSQPPGFADYQDPLLHFGLSDTPPLLVQTENAPIIGVEAFLHFEEDEGLSLLWYTPLQEDSEDLDDLRRTPISNLITKVEYVYWDERFEKWETETEPKEGEDDDQFILPRFLKLTFEYEGVIKERSLTIPVTSRNALIF